MCSVGPTRIIHHHIKLQMKNAIGKYLFEVIVIFIGITSSFLFEEWRQNREKDQKTSEIVQALLVELERNDSFIKDIDTTYTDVNTSIQNILNDENITRLEVMNVAYTLLEGISQIRLKEISSFIHGFSSNDHINIISTNKEVLRYLTYLESLLAEHEFTTITLTESNSSKLWPLLNRYQLVDDILNEQRELVNLDEITSDRPKRDISEFLSNTEFREQLKWSQLKVLRLIQINQAIHMQIRNISQELNRVKGA